MCSSNTIGMQHNTNYVYAACSKDSESTLNQFWQMWIDRRKEMYNIRILSQSIFTHMCSVEIWSLYVDWNCRHSIFHCNIFPCYFYEYCLHPKRRFIHNFSILARNYCFFSIGFKFKLKTCPRANELIFKSNVIWHICQSVGSAVFWTHHRGRHKRSCGRGVQGE